MLLSARDQKRRGGGRPVAMLVFLLVLGGAAVRHGFAEDKPAAQGTAPGIATAFEDTCRERMRDLASRERRAVEGIAWEIVPGGVRGTYLGYHPDYVCTVRDDAGASPRGRMQYQEVVYEKRGADIRAAAAATPKPIEIHQVTAIFLYRDGAWR